MSKRAALCVFAVACLGLAGATPAAEMRTREFRASDGGKLELDLDAGGSVTITGDGGSAIVVAYSSSCTPACEIGFEESGAGLEISTRFSERGSRQKSDIDLEIRVPRRFDVKIESAGGGLKIDGIEGRFSGQTMGGELVLHAVRGQARLKTMGGRIQLTDSELDGSLETMGGEVLFENVIGDVKGSSMGGNVRYKNVRRRDGGLGSPPRVEGHEREITSNTVQISTMGGKIEVDEAPEGADVHTMGGDIEIADARRFVRAKTMGGDIEIAAIDGWVQATTMGGNVQVTVTGGGGDVELVSMSGDVDLTVPSGFGMDLDLEIAFTRNSRQDYRIEAPGGVTSTVTPDWDDDKGSPRKTIRASGPVGGGGHKVTIRTVNGNITIR